MENDKTSLSHLFRRRLERMTGGLTTRDQVTLFCALYLSNIRRGKGQGGRSVKELAKWFRINYQTARHIRAEPNFEQRIRDLRDEFVVFCYESVSKDFQRFLACWHQEMRFDSRAKWWSWATELRTYAPQVKRRVCEFISQEAVTPLQREGEGRVFTDILVGLILGETPRAVSDIFAWKRFLELQGQVIKKALVHEEEHRKLANRSVEFLLWLASSEMLQQPWFGSARQDAPV